MNKIKILQDLEQQVIDCKKCDLYKERAKPAFSRGNPETKIMIVGEACGFEESLQGLPFVGRSGQLLDKALAACGLDPQVDVYVANIIKCRPPNNRRPETKEVEECIGYLELQIEQVEPKVILTLGSTSTNTLLNKTLSITKVRGTLQSYHKINVIPTLHPSYILRSGGENSSNYQLFLTDIKLAIQHSQ